MIYKVQIYFDSTQLLHKPRSVTMATLLDAKETSKLTCNFGSASACSNASALAGDCATLARGGGRGGLTIRDGRGASPAGLLPPVEDPLRASAFSSSNGFVSCGTCNNTLKLSTKCIQIQILLQ